MNGFMEGIENYENAWLTSILVTHCECIFPKFPSALVPFFQIWNVEAILEPFKIW